MVKYPQDIDNEGYETRHGAFGVAYLKDMTDKETLASVTPTWHAPDRPMGQMDGRDSISAKQTVFDTKMWAVRSKCRFDRSR
ncbi:unnamed protein product [Dovyalis caffra]|uniref:Uncharacterized protein n=1 Tax=Dovyalis caffra TaxID=77055 RepID=A0AAV1SSS8_9ROSI|nr:unnamed protein product [Dovyalis caffra]